MSVSALAITHHGILRPGDINLRPFEASFNGLPYPTTNDDILSLASWAEEHVRLIGRLRFRPFTTDELVKADTVGFINGYESTAVIVARLMRTLEYLKKTLPGISPPWGHSRLSPRTELFFQCFSVLPPLPHLDSPEADRWNLSMAKCLSTYYAQRTLKQHAREHLTHVGYIERTVYRIERNSARAWTTDAPYRACFGLGYLNKYPQTPDGFKSDYQLIKTVMVAATAMGGLRQLNNQYLHCEFGAQLTYLPLQGFQWVLLMATPNAALTRYVEGRVKSVWEHQSDGKLLLNPRVDITDPKAVSDYLTSLAKTEQYVRPMFPGDFRRFYHTT